MLQGLFLGIGFASPACFARGFRRARGTAVVAAGGRSAWCGFQPYLVVLRQALGWGIFLLVWGSGLSGLDNVIRPFSSRAGQESPPCRIRGVLGGFRRSGPSASLQDRSAFLVLASLNLPKKAARKSLKTQAADWGGRAVQSAPLWMYLIFLTASTRPTPGGWLALGAALVLAGAAAARPACWCIASHGLIQVEGASPHSILP